MKSYLSASRALEWYLDSEAGRVSIGKTRLLEMEHIIKGVRSGRADRIRAEVSA